MDTSTTIKIKSIVHSVLPDARVILFGSRARGDEKDKSDYDFLLITENNFLVKEKLNLKAKIRKLLVYALDSPVDVLLNMNKEVEIKKELCGHIVRTALKEGVEL